MKVKDLLEQLKSLDGERELVISIRQPAQDNKWHNQKYNVPIFVNGKPQWGWLDIYTYNKPTASKAVINKADAAYDEVLDEGLQPNYCDAYTFDSFIKRYERMLKLGYKPAGPFKCGFDTIHTQRSNHEVPLFNIKVTK